ncbi:condensation domain-containing protein [Nonomuraea aurantiaca]|uniref:condensation domain-containing protein n=1 Tax=Nonomuraea aurantiaca TaxID=2878562 RepID=UPI001CDA378D|nr:condensation domain-containing protein [Nonomuraea aurantiaca]MCA2230003.1 condensation domain-containing protein [Nonomuraea aurantiaca]
MTAVSELERLLPIWSELLDVAHVEPTDNFVALGGHSVAAARLTARVRRLFGVDLPVSAVFAAGTPAALAARIAAGPPVTTTPFAQPERPSMSPTQRLQWFAEKFSDGHSPYTIPLTLRLRGAVDLGALRRALRGLVTRHQILRTTYGDQDGQPQPRIEPADSFATGMVRVPETQLADWLRAEARRPFDLAAQLPIRATLCRLSADHHVLSIVVHHIAADGWSRAVILDDLNALYAFHRGTGPAPEPAIQYTDVACVPENPADVAWWADRLRGAPARTTFPSPESRPAALSDAGGSVSLPIGSELTARIRRLAATTGVTPYAVCMAALTALLSEYSGESDVVVATSTAGRADWEAERVVGCFINTMAIRTDTSDDPSPRELSRRVQDATLAALDHPTATFDSIVRALAPPRDPAYRPLCQVMLTMHNEPGLRPTLVDLDVEWIEVDNGGAKCDVFVDLTDDGGPLRGALVYRTQLYDADFAQALAARYVTLLSHMADHPERPLSAYLGGDDAD